MVLPKYLGDSKMFEYDKHFRDCQHLNKPFIKARINPQNGHYFVQIDLMTCDYELSNKEQDEIKQLVENEIKYVKFDLKSNFHGFSINKELAWFDGISSKHMDNFCNSLYDLTQKYHN